MSAARRTPQRPIARPTAEQPAQRCPSQTGRAPPTAVEKSVEIRSDTAHHDWRLAGKNAGDLPIPQVGHFGDGFPRRAMPEIERCRAFLW
jgi:hypothetical protein